MMQKLAAFAMAARWRAVLTATLSAAAALVLPPLTSPLSYLGGAVVGLVSLRLGAREGAGVLIAGVVVLAALGAALGGLAAPLAVATLILWLPVWLAALLLRISCSLGLTLRVLGAVGVILVMLAHLWLGDTQAWWLPRLEEVLKPAFEGQGIDAGDYVAELARWMTGLLGAALVMSVALSLLLARAWQAGLYNPGGFAAEFRELALGRAAAVAGLALIALAALSPAGAVKAFAADAVPTLLVLYVVQGLAVAHALAARYQAKRGWLIALYVLLLLAAPQVMPLVALLGWSDAWIDVRRRFGRP